MLLCAELKARKVRLSSFPIIARVNTNPSCNLRCPACQRIAKTAAPSGGHMMTLSQYREVVDQIAEHLLLVVLYDEGEPLLNLQLPEIIRYTESLNISTSISTNLAMPLSDQYMLDLITSGLDRITVSMDGMTQQVYEAYRVGGDVSLLKENMERLLSLKRRTRSKTYVEVQFIAFGFNDHEKRDIRDYAYRMGADNFRALSSSIHGLEEHFAETGRTLTEEDHLRRGCLDVWGIAHIGSDGNLFPCDFGEDNGMQPLGNLFQEEFTKLWNAPRMARIRAYFNRRVASFDAALCRRCPASNPVPRVLR